MNVTLKALVSALATVSFASSVLKEPDNSGGIRLNVANNELARLLEKGMKCRVEYPDRTSKDVRVREIIREKEMLLVNCVPVD
jgi:hypothetical protein